MGARREGGAGHLTPVSARRRAAPAFGAQESLGVDAPPGLMRALGGDVRPFPVRTPSTKANVGSTLCSPQSTPRKEGTGAHGHHGMGTLAPGYPRVSGTQRDEEGGGRYQWRGAKHQLFRIMQEKTTIPEFWLFTVFAHCTAVTAEVRSFHSSWQPSRASRCAAPAQPVEGTARAFANCCTIR